MTRPFASGVSTTPSTDQVGSPQSTPGIVRRSPSLPWMNRPDREVRGVHRHVRLEVDARLSFVVPPPVDREGGARGQSAVAASPSTTFVTAHRVSCDAVFVTSSSGARPRPISPSSLGLQVALAPLVSRRQRSRDPARPPGGSRPFRSGTRWALPPRRPGRPVCRRPGARSARPRALPGHGGHVVHHEGVDEQLGRHRCPRGSLTTWNVPVSTDASLVRVECTVDAPSAPMTSSIGSKRRAASHCARRPGAVQLGESDHRAVGEASGRPVRPAGLTGVPSPG